MRQTSSDQLTQRNKKGKRRGKQTSAVGEYANDAWSLAKRTAIGLNEIRKLINVETKHIENVFSTVVGTTAHIKSLTQVAQGLTDQNRIGDSIKLQHISFTCVLECNTSTAYAPCRITILRDLGGYGTIPTVADIFENVSTPLLAIVTPFNYLNKERFSILYDELLTVDPASKRVAICSYYASHEGHVKYLLGTAAAAADGIGTVYLIIQSTDDTNKSVPSYATRVLFTDD